MSSLKSDSNVQRSSMDHKFSSLETNMSNLGSDLNNQRSSMDQGL